MKRESALNEHLQNIGHEKTDLKQWVPEMLLVILRESNACFIILFTLLVSEFAYMTPGLASLSAIPRFDDLSPSAKRAKSTLARYERRVLIGQQLAHDRSTRVGVLRLVCDFTFTASGCCCEGLCEVASHAAMSDAVA